MGEEENPRSERARLPQCERTGGRAVAFSGEMGAGSRRVDACLGDARAPAAAVIRHSPLAVCNIEVTELHIVERIERDGIEVTTFG